MNNILFFVLIVLSILIFVNLFNKKNINETFYNWNDNCSYLNFYEPDMIVLEKKDGTIMRFGTGIFIRYIPTDDIEGISIKGYSTMHLRIQLHPYTDNIFVWKAYTNFNDNLHTDINSNVIKGKDLPFGRIVELRARCNKPVNGKWSNWTISNPCHWESDGFCYYEKKRKCTCTKPAFGGLRCIGPKKLKIDCECGQLLPENNPN